MKKGKNISGGKYKKSRKKRKFEIAGQKRVVKLDEKEKRKTLRTKGGNKKSVLLNGLNVNVRDKNKVQKTKIKNVTETPSNRFLARQNIITKGAIVETELGKVKITNKPSQEGIINGVLVE